MMAMDHASQKDNVPERVGSVAEGASAGSMVAGETMAGGAAAGEATTEGAAAVDTSAGSAVAGETMARGVATDGEVSTEGAAPGDPSAGSAGAEEAPEAERPASPDARAAASASATQRLYERAKRIIPGGVQLLSKRPEQMAPGLWPAYYREARGCEVWDLDGRHYYDLSTNGIGACLLGFRDEDVTRAAIGAIEQGSMSTLNPPEEVELAERLCAIHPWAQQVRFTRSGGESCAAAIRIARATTGRSVVAVCGYHGWHDWYLSANLGETEALSGHLLPGLDPAGVPKELTGTVPTFAYNDREAFRSILDRYGPRLACVIMEPCRYRDPEPGFLEYVRDEAHRAGALLVFDEITIGWRLTYGGAHLRLGVAPDIAVFAKALGNGHPIGAVIGTEQAMKGAHLSFISSTYWTERVGPAAALATLEKMEATGAAAHAGAIGERIMASWSRNAARHGLPVEAGDGYACLAHFRFVHDQAEQLRTLYTQLMLERGFLAGTAVYPTLAHTENIVNMYDESVDGVFAVIADALREDKVEQSLRGPTAHSGFRRLL